MASSSSSAAAAPDVVERSRLWLLQRSQALEGAQQQRQAELASSSSSTPFLSPTSARLAAQQPRGAVDVSTRLFRDAEALRAARRQLEEDALATLPVPVPAITKFAAEMRREGAVSDRLYDDARASEERHRAAVAAQNAAQDARRRPVVGEAAVAQRRAQQQLQQQQQLGASGGASNGAGAVAVPPGASHGGAGLGLAGPSAGAAVTLSAPKHSVDDLYRMAAEQRARNERAIAQANKDARLAAKPKLNSKSLILAANMSEAKLLQLYHRSGAKGGGPATADASENAPPASSSASDSSAQHAPASPSKQQGQSQNHLPGSPVGMRRGGSDEAEFTFHPRIQARSVALAARHYSSFSGAGAAPRVEERLLAELKKMEARRKEFARSMAEYEVRGCTFRPNADRRDEAGGAGASGGAPDAVGKEAARRLFDEQRAWLAERERRRSEAQRDNAERELVGCTFQPVIKPQPTRQRRASISGLPAHAGQPQLPAHTPLAAGGRAKSRRSSLPGGGGGGVASATTFGSSVGGSLLAALASADADVSGSGQGLTSGALDRRPLGLDSHMERQRRARDLAFERANPPFADGSKWTGQPTSFSTFRFATEGEPAAAAQVQAQAQSQARAGGAGASVPVPVHTRGAAAFAAVTAGAGASTGAPASAAALSSQIIAASVGRVVAAAQLPPPPPQPLQPPQPPVAAPAATSSSAELTTADDIRARLRQLESQQSQRASAASAAATAAAAAATAAAAPLPLALTALSAQASSRGSLFAAATAARSAAAQAQLGLAGLAPPVPPPPAPPAMRFAPAIAAAAAEGAGAAGSASGSGARSPDPLLRRLEAMSQAVLAETAAKQHSRQGAAQRRPGV